MKRIGLMIPNLFFGGAERVISKLSIILSDLGYDVYLILFNSNNIEFEFKGTLIDISVDAKDGLVNKVVNILRRCKRLNKIKKEHELDIIISFLRAADIVNFFTFGINRKIYSIRGFDDYEKNKKLYRFILKFSRGSILVQTKRLKNYILEENNQKYENKIIVLGNPFDINDIEKKCHEGVNNEIELLTNSYKCICCVGSFKKAKNHWNLLKSFIIVKQKIPNAKLILIGANGELEKNIRDMAQKTMYSKDIIFVGNKSNPFRIISRCDVFVLPSLSEGIPNTLVEAMACGVPVISTDCKTGPREILYEYPNLNKNTEGIEYGDFGILVQSFENDIDFNYNKISQSNYILAEAIEKVLLDNKLQEKYKQLSIAGANRLDINNYKNTLINIIENY